MRHAGVVNPAVARVAGEHRLHVAVHRRLVVGGDRVLDEDCHGRRLAIGGDEVGHVDGVGRDALAQSDDAGGCPPAPVPGGAAGQTRQQPGRRRLRRRLAADSVDLPEAVGQVAQRRDVVGAVDVRAIEQRDADFLVSA